METESSSNLRGLSLTSITLTTTRAADDRTGEPPSKATRWNRNSAFDSASINLLVLTVNC